MLEFIRPDTKAAATWIAVWLVALVGLALVPVDTTMADITAPSSHVEQSDGNVNTGAIIKAPSEKIPG